MGCVVGLSVEAVGRNDGIFEGALVGRLVVKGFLVGPTDGLEG